MLMRQLQPATPRTMRTSFKLLLVAAVAACATAQPNISIATLLPLSGANAVFGAAMRNASLLFASMANDPTSAGGGGIVVGGRRLMLDLPAFDDRSNATFTGLAAGSFLRAANTSFLVGPYGSELTLALMGAVYDGRFTASGGGTFTTVPAPSTLMMFPAASTTGLFAAYPRTASPLQATSSRFVNTLSALAEVGARTVLMAVQTTLLFTVDACTVDVASFGLTLLARVEVRNTGTDAVAAVDAVAALRPDIVLMCSVFATTRAVVREARARGVNAGAWVGFTLFDDVAFPSDDTLPRSFVMDGAPWMPVVVGPPRFTDRTCAIFAPTGVGCINPAQFNARFIATFGRPAAIEAATTFASLEMMVQAIAAANSTDPLAVAPLLRGRYWDTVYGRILIGAETGHNMGDVFTRQAQQNGVAIISGVGGARLVYPAPTWQRQECEATTRCGAGGACRDDGSCECGPWHAGATCSIAFGVASLAVGCCLAVAAIITLSVRLQQWRTWAAVRAKAAQEARESGARTVALRTAHRQTMGYAAHEMANPLHTMAAVLDELASGALPSQRGLRYLRSAIAKMRQVVDDMLTSAGGDIALDALRILPSRVRLLELLRDVGHRLRQAHDVRLRVRLAQGPAPDGVVLVDSLRLFQLLVHTCALLGDGSTADREGCIELSATVRRGEEQPASDGDVPLQLQLVAMRAPLTGTHTEAVVVLADAPALASGGAGYTAAASTPGRGAIEAGGGSPAAHLPPVPEVATPSITANDEVIDVMALPVAMLAPAGVATGSTSSAGGSEPSAARSIDHPAASTSGSVPSGRSEARQRGVGAAALLPPIARNVSPQSLPPPPPLAVLSFATVLDATTCSRIAEAMGGSLDMRLGDEPPAFTLRLPVTLPPPPPPLPAAGEADRSVGESDDGLEPLPAAVGEPRGATGGARSVSTSIFSTGLTLPSSDMAPGSDGLVVLSAHLTAPAPAATSAAGTGLAPPLAAVGAAVVASMPPSPPLSLRVRAPAALQYGADRPRRGSGGSSEAELRIAAAGKAGSSTVTMREAESVASGGAGAAADHDLTADSFVAAASPAVPLVAAGPASRGPRSLTPTRGAVLVVEDERVNAKLLARMLSHAGFAPSLLYDGADVPWLQHGTGGSGGGAVDASGSPFLAILLDIVMPRTNGVDVCRDLRAAGFTGPIIATTANVSTADVARYRAAGFDDVLAKPFGRGDVTAVLDRWLPPHPLVPAGTPSVAVGSSSDMSTAPGGGGIAAVALSRGASGGSTVPTA